MSFRLFIWYCSLCGGCAAYVGWALGRFASPESSVMQAAVKGMFLGMMVALSLGLIDALWSLHWAQVHRIGARVLVAVGVGTVGGFLGGLVGQALYHFRHWSVFLIFGWAMTGLLIGAAPGVFDVLARLAREEDLGGALRKIGNGLLGGFLGGLLGSVLFLMLQSVWGLIFRDRVEDFWSPSATGFVALGMCIGLLIGLAQVILKEAWVKVESGFRPGRELILSKPEVVIGRAEGCDIGLFGDNSVERTHARILRKGRQYLLDDAGTPGGTYINGERVAGPTPLRAGDRIQVGRCVLLFGERRKQAEGA
jgi:FHA domain-containing protein